MLDSAVSELNHLFASVETASLELGLDPALKSSSSMLAEASLAGELTQNQSALNQGVFPKQRHQRFWLWAMLRRLSLVAAIGGCAVIGGIAVAQRYPAVRHRAPWLEQGLQGWQATQQHLTGLAQDTLLKPLNLGEANPVQDLASEPVDRAIAALQLNPVVRETLQTQLTRAEADLDHVFDTVNLLEAQLGLEASSLPLEDRLVAIATQLQPDLVSALSVEPLRITLPSDTLFATGASVLDVDSREVLRDVLRELRRHPGSTVQIATYSDAVGAAETNRTLTFRQSQAIVTYLADRLSSQYHWEPLGMGAAKPVVTGTTQQDRQRNRRVEIVIQP